LTSSSWVVTSARRRRWMVCRLVSARNSDRPVRSSYSSAPSENRSDAGRSFWSWWVCSGDRYSIDEGRAPGDTLPVPVAPPMDMVASAVGERVRPYRPRVRRPSPVTHTVDGDKARCRTCSLPVSMPGLECRASRALHSCAASCRYTLCGIGWPAATDATRTPSSTPSGWSSTTYRSPSISCAPWTRASPGWARTERRSPARLRSEARREASRPTVGNTRRTTTCLPAGASRMATYDSATASADSFRISVNGPTFLGRDIGTVHPSAVPAPAERRG
jgi:hypothetical protein